MISDKHMYKKGYKSKVLKFASPRDMAKIKKISKIIIF